MTQPRPRTATANGPTWDDVARMLAATDVNPRSRDTSAASKASAEVRRRSAAERRAVEFAADVPLLSEATLAQLTELLMVTCVDRGIPVPEV